MKRRFSRMKWSIEKIKEKWRAFNAWQKQPYVVAPMNSEQHTCATCETVYEGNFCPRCGQSRHIEPKMSLWRTFLLFLDVWGIGNRGMFRTIRDLMLRPGYLICDYIRGKRNAYFPPFKLLFLLTTLSLIIGHGWNLAHKNYQEEAIAHEQQASEKENREDFQNLESFYRHLEEFDNIQREYPALARLGYTIFLSFFFFILFHKSRVVGNLSYHEFLIAMVYMVNMANIYTVVLRFFGAGPVWVSLPTLLYLVPLKQMSGYSWWATVGKTLLSLLLMLAAIFLIVIATSLWIVLSSPR